MKQQVLEMFEQFDKTFAWKPSGQRDVLLPSEMRTSHLFNTVKMIWNHVMPYPFTPFKQYAFGEFYTLDYMLQAFRALGAELCARDDLQPYMRRTLLEMSEHYLKPDCTPRHVPRAARARTPAHGQWRGVATPLFPDLLDDLWDECHEEPW